MYRQPLAYVLAVWLAALVPAHAQDKANQDLDRLVEARLAYEAGDAARARAIYSDLWKAGLPQAGLELGLLIAAGVDGPADPRGACDLYEKAAAGLPAAATRIGLCYLDGNGRPADHRRSLEWFRKAADQGDAAALCAIGRHHLEGLGVPRDPSKAVALCTEAAERGDVTAQAALGRLYLGGRGVPRSVGDAEHWLTLAAESGEPDAAYHLGMLYWTGDGVDQDRDLAADWFGIAADSGQRDAPKALGDYFFLLAFAGGQTMIDPESGLAAAYWLSIAAEHDPDGDDRQKAAAMRDRVLRAAPQMKAEIDGMLGAE